MSRCDKGQNESKNHEIDLNEYTKEGIFDKAIDENAEFHCATKKKSRSDSLNSMEEIQKTITSSFEKFQLPDVEKFTTTVSGWHSENIAPILKIADEMSEQQKLIVETLQSLVIPNLNIDFGMMNDIAMEMLQETKEVLSQFEEELWCIDMDILDYFSTEEITEERLVVYLQQNLEGYVDEMITSPIFKRHKSLLIETLAAYKSGYYKLCTYSLLSIIENRISSWYLGEDKKSNSYVPRLHCKIKKMPVVWEEKVELIKLFIQTIFKIYVELFKSNKEYLNGEINRHTIAHGTHDYDSIGQIDVLKLFQFLKASFILKDFKYDELISNK